MSRPSLLLVAAALAVFGVAVMSGHPPWGAVTGISILLTAAAHGGRRSGRTKSSAGCGSLLNSGLPLRKFRRAWSR